MYSCVHLSHLMHQQHSTDTYIRICRKCSFSYTFSLSSFQFSLSKLEITVVFNLFKVHSEFRFDQEFSGGKKTVHALELMFLEWKKDRVEQIVLKICCTLNVDKHFCIICKIFLPFVQIKRRPE